MAPASSKEFLDIQVNYRVWIHPETRTWHDNDIQSLLFYDKENSHEIISKILFHVSFSNQKTKVFKKNFEFKGHPQRIRKL